MSVDGADAAKIKQFGWRQGSVIPQTIVDRLRGDGSLPLNFGTSDILMVISHDCDVTREDFSSEPNAELLVVRVSNNRDGNFFWCNSPRRLQIETKASGQSLVYEMSIHDRFNVSRTYLTLAGPNNSQQFAEETIQQIALWISRRYSRQSFPDAFNDRTRPAISKLSKEFKRNGDCISGIYLVVTDEELPTGQDYLIVLRATMTVEHFANEPRRKRAMELLTKLEAALGECGGIDVRASDIVSEAQISLDDLRQMRRWDFDSISLRTETVASLPPVS